MNNINKRVLVVVDAQRDFIEKNGNLPVPNAEAIVSNIQAKINSGDYDTIIYTMDTHIKEDYITSDESKMFPMHCEFQTYGWSLSIQPVNNNVNKMFNMIDSPTDFSFGNEFVFMKDVFSIWDGNSQYANFMKSFDKDTTFDVVGVATNYCVFQNVMGMDSFGFDVNIIKDCVKEIPDDSFEPNVTIMKNSNIKFI